MKKLFVVYVHFSSQLHYTVYGVFLCTNEFQISTIILCSLIVWAPFNYFIHGVISHVHFQREVIMIFLIFNILQLYIRVAPALVPPVVFTAVPRTPPLVYDPIVLRPIDTYGTLSRAVGCPALNDTECNEDAEDSFDESELESPDLQEGTDRAYVASLSV